MSEPGQPEQTEKSGIIAIIPALVLVGAGLSVGQWSVYMASSELFIVACILGLIGVVWLGANTMNRFFED